MFGLKFPEPPNRCLDSIETMWHSTIHLRRRVRYLFHHLRSFQRGPSLFQQRFDAASSRTQHWSRRSSGYLLDFFATSKKEKNRLPELQQQVTEAHLGESGVPLKKNHGSRL